MNRTKAKAAGWLVVAEMAVCAGVWAQAGTPAAPAVPAAPVVAPAGAEMPSKPVTTPAAGATTVAPGPAGGAKSDAKVTQSGPGAGSSTAGAAEPGQALDRLVAVVNGDLVLESDVEEERRMAVLQPVRDPSGNFSREQAIERLIDRTLILQQAKLQAQTPVTDAEVEAEIGNLRKEIPACKQMHCETAAGWAQFLKENGLTEAEVVRERRARMEVLRYIEVRFRSGVRITQREERSYYDEQMLPEYAKRGVKAPEFDVVSQRIEEVLLQEQVTNLLQDWLKSLRAQGSVQMMKPGEMAP